MRKIKFSTAIRLIKILRSMKYGEKFCLNCMSVYGGGNSGQQYCCEDENGNLRFLEQQTGSSYVRPRRFELVNDLKLVGFSQKRACRITGKTVEAWKVLQTRLIDYYGN